jgi:hypothetical protein
MYPFDLWLRHDSDWTSLGKELFREVWQIPWSGLNVNVAFGKNGAPELVADAITAIRSIRVGHEARHAHISIWVDFRNVTKSLLSILEHHDTFVPRINLVLVYTPQNGCLAEISDELMQLSFNKLSTKILVAISELGDALISYKNLLDHIRRSKGNYQIIVDYFPPLIEASLSETSELISRLELYGYDFGKHALYLCGSVTRMCQIAFLRRVCKNDANRITHIRSSPFSDIEQLACSFECIKHCAPERNIFDGHYCFCHAPINDVQIEQSAYEAITKSFSNPEDQILFEDWQYIYDGFEMI